MKIVIAGAGEVGTHLTKMLEREERHDIVLLDDNEYQDKVSELAAKLDILTVKGSSYSLKDMKEAGAGKADLFIAVTPYEERNILACQLAKKLGAKKCVGRVDNQEYIMPENSKILADMGVDELIYPEHLAALEIADYVKITGARQVYEFSGGKLILFGVKIRNGASILGKNFETIGSEIRGTRAVAINRASTTIIPRGKDTVELGDIVFFISKPDTVSQIIQAAGKADYEVKKVMILGGGKVGMKSAMRISERLAHPDIKIIEMDRKRCLKVADLLEDSMVIHGDGRDVDLLKSEGIEGIDAFIAVTGNAETNILSCQMAKKLGVKRTIAEVENLDYIDFAEAIGIGGVINKKHIAASHIYRYTVSDNVTYVRCLTASDAEVLEFEVSEGDPITKRQIRDLRLPEDASIGGYIRNNEGHIATGDTTIQPGDKVVLFSGSKSVKSLGKFFNQK